MGLTRLIENQQTSRKTGEIDTAQFEGRVLESEAQKETVKTRKQAGKPAR